MSVTIDSLNRADISSRTIIGLNSPRVYAITFQDNSVKYYLIGLVTVGSVADNKTFVGMHFYELGSDGAEAMVKFSASYNIYGNTYWNYSDKENTSFLKAVFPNYKSHFEIQENQLIQFIIENFATLMYDPVYAEATRINYTDGSYDIVRSILNESEAKNYAYNQLLNTYGTFYKANEIELSSYYNGGGGAVTNIIESLSFTERMVA